MRILLVEDDEFARDATLLFLREFAYVDFAVDAKSALAIFKQNDPYDLLIVDYGLPDGNGKQFLEDVRLLDYEPKAVFYTGNLPEALGMACGDFRRLNVADIWTKPISFTNLRERVENIIEHGAFAYCQR